MPSNSLKSRSTAALMLAILLAPAWVPADAGVISGLIAKRRVQRQMRTEARPTGISTLDGSTVGGPAPSSIADRFKKRFAFKGRGNGAATSVSTPNVFSSDRDPSLFRSSR